MVGVYQNSKNREIAKSKIENRFKNRNVSRNRKSRNQKTKIVSKIGNRFKNRNSFHKKRKSRNQKSKFTSGKIDIRAQVRRQGGFFVARKPPFRLGRGSSSGARIYVCARDASRAVYNSYIYTFNNYTRAHTYLFPVLRPPLRFSISKRQCQLAILSARVNVARMRK